MEQDYRPQPLEAPSASQGGNTSGGEFTSERDYVITHIGIDYRLSQESLENPAVYQYLGLTIDSEHLWTGMYGEAAHRGDEQSFRQFLDELRGFSSSPSEFGPSIGIRLHQTEQVIAAIGIVMGDRLEYAINMNDQIAFLIGEAVKPLGLHVSHQPFLAPEKRAEMYQLLSSQEQNVWEPSDIEEEEQLTLFPSGVYHHYFSVPQFRAPSQRTRPEELARFAKVAQELAIPEAHWSNERVRGYINVLIESRDLLAKFQEGERQPGAPGLMPPVGQRLQTSAEMMQAVVSLLEAGFHGKKLDTADIAQHLNNALTANYGISITETLQTVAPGTEGKNETPLSWQQDIIAFTQQEPYAETVKAFPTEPIDLLENLYWKARMQKDTNAAYTLEGLLDGYIASTFPFLPPLIQEQYTKRYYDRGYLAPTEEEEGLCFTDEEYSYLNRLLEVTNIVELYKQKGESEIPHFNKGENEQYIRLNPVLTEMRKIATKMGLEWENTQASSGSEGA